MAENDVHESFQTGIGRDLQGTYSEVHVLLIVWAKNDLTNIESEVSSLRKVFEQDYQYTNVTVFRIPATNSAVATSQLHLEISKLVADQSGRENSLLVLYYAGHCSPNNQGQAEWAAFEENGPTVPWHIAQQLLFSVAGDVLLILDCCHASLISQGSKLGSGRFEMIAACAKGARTPMPGRSSFTTRLVKILQEYSERGTSSERLTSELREDPKITETPVFHDFVRQYRTTIPLKRLEDKFVSQIYMKKPAGYFLFRASLSGDVTGLQIAEWLKTAPPANVTAVSIEAIVSRARKLQGALENNIFPSDSMLGSLSDAAKSEISRCLKGLDTVMACSEETISSNTIQQDDQRRETVDRVLRDMESGVSSVCRAVETPLLLARSSTSDTELEKDGAYGLAYSRLTAAVGVETSLELREAIRQEDASAFSLERDKSDIKILRGIGREGGRFKYGLLYDKPVILDTYKYKEDMNGEPDPQAIRQVSRMTGLLRHPKRWAFHHLPCAGFFRNRYSRELGILFYSPRSFKPGDQEATVTLRELFTSHRVVPLGHRIHLCWALSTAVEHFHRVGWVHKTIRSNNIAFFLESEVSAPNVSTPINSTIDNSGITTSSLPFVDNKDLSKPLLFGFEHARSGSGTTDLGGDYSPENNVYRHPDRWGTPTRRFEKSYDVYSLGVVLLEVAFWKDVRKLLQEVLKHPQLKPQAVREELEKKCRKMLPHQVGQMLTDCILICLNFDQRTKGLSEYDSQVYFQQNVTNRIAGAVRMI